MSNSEMLAKIERTINNIAAAPKQTSKEYAEAARDHIGLVLAELKRCKTEEQVLEVLGNHLDATANCTGLLLALAARADFDLSDAGDGTEWLRWWTEQLDG